VSSVRRFARRARRRRLRQALPWLLVLAALAVLGGAAAVVTRTGLLGVGTVRVVGGDPDEVRLFAAVPPGTPLATLDLGAIRRRVAGYPPIASVSVRRLWPRTVVIHVRERTPTAVEPLVGSFALLDASGVAYRQLAAPPPGLPVVRLTEPAPDPVTARAAMTVLAALPPALTRPLVQLVADAPTRIRLELSGGRVIVWGDATQNAEKVRVVTNVLSGPDGATTQTLDVSAPSVVMVR
jgi:cell division protein FtsQ